MALLTCHVESEVLETSTTFSAIVPQDEASPPVLYLLHGITDDHTAWSRYTSIERYADEAGLAVVMPSAFNSFYTDEVHGHGYWTFVSEELPRLVRCLFRVSDRPEHTFAAGLAMGGYGAVKLALTYPDRYAAAASLSGPLDITYMAAREDRAAIWHRAFDAASETATTSSPPSCARLRRCRRSTSGAARPTRSSTPTSATSRPRPRPAST